MLLQFTAQAKLTLVSSSGYQHNTNTMLIANAQNRQCFQTSPVHLAGGGMEGLVLLW